MITLWGGATSRTLRAHWMIHELDIEYTPELIGSRTGATQTDAFRALNPKEKIPVLVDDDLVLTESVAIVTYLGDTYGAESGLVPKPYTHERAHYNEWASFIQMELDAHTLYVMRKHRDLAELYGEAPAAIETAIAGFNKQVAVAESRLTEQAYLLGDTFTAADLLLMTCLDWAEIYGITLAETFEPYRDRIHQRPAFQRSAELNFSISPGG
ncbi:MAG: glutathione S-transferase family protein [Gammaproteobacteria bacterium]|nr:glutathione S-transferase family protein [Gammaproteobacteria bacterium]